MKQEDDLVTTRQLAATCTVAAVVAVLMGWGLARPDVWKLSEDIHQVANQVSKLSHDMGQLQVTQTNNQVTNTDTDREKLIREGRDIVLQGWVNENVRGDQSGHSDSSSYVGSSSGGIRGSDRGSDDSIGPNLSRTNSAESIKHGKSDASAAVLIPN